ncbi:hypothetical protein DL89DRAFT_74158 [Linderina pennispora]|uniref:Uncharacterized protein n=1 Tax=Linderina pennispora TaxID=61395 RepID=A0A1Y1VR21_9FUNG|nr:uncharacterized protein DL89DRAFT_74158 [Linderina pennispora]ORX63623.1 hypothetical protein DL89DRAFT_74158 [Linderina pennispora]
MNRPAGGSKKTGAHTPACKLRIFRCHCCVLGSCESANPPTTKAMAVLPKHKPPGCPVVSLRNALFVPVTHTRGASYLTPATATPGLFFAHVPLTTPKVHLHSSHAPLSRLFLPTSKKKRLLPAQRPLASCSLCTSVCHSLPIGRHIPADVQLHIMQVSPMHAAHVLGFAMQRKCRVHYEPPQPPLSS